MERTAAVERKTSETDIRVFLNLDSIEPSRINSGVPFLDHMLNSMSRHGRFYTEIDCKGDTEIDDHHSAEDIAICLGKAFSEALGDKSGIRRFGHAVVPMDESLSCAAVDLSGRAFFRYTGQELQGYIKNYSEELTLEFFRTFSLNAGMNLHIELKYGDNRHHIHEAIFKSAGVALHSAFTTDSSLSGTILSTKGTIV